MNVNILMPSLYSRLLNRALMSAMNHGAEVQVTPVVVTQENPCHEGVRFVHDTEPKGSNHANRIGFAACDDDAIVVMAADDVLFKKDWLAYCLPAFLKLEDGPYMGAPFIMGIRHIGGIGTCYGRMYANFPMFRKSVALKCGLEFFPDWLTGWGDVAFGLSCWQRRGIVKDSETPDGEPFIKWGDRMGMPESQMKYGPHNADMAALREHFPNFSEGWPTEFRGFNIDCPTDMLEKGTIYQPDCAKFHAMVKGKTNAVVA